MANQANSYIADVAEFDWSFTGQFAGAQWVEPLEGLVAPSTLSDLKSTDAAFVSGGKTYAAATHAPLLIFPNPFPGKIVEAGFFNEDWSK